MPIACDDHLLVPQIGIGFSRGYEAGTGKAKSALIARAARTPRPVAIAPASATGPCEALGTSPTSTKGEGGARSRDFVMTPPFAEKPPILPPAATTRWHGTMIANGFRARACQRREPSPRRRSAPRGRRMSSSRPGECHARPRRRGGGMAARGPCRAEPMKDRPATLANARRYCPARATSDGGAPLARVEIAGARARAFGSLASGSCTPTTPRAPHVIAHRPIAVSKSVKNLHGAVT